MSYEKELQNEIKAIRAISKWLQQVPPKSRQRILDYVANLPDETKQAEQEKSAE
jgi:hypothetical protein